MNSFLFYVKLFISERSGLVPFSLNNPVIKDKEAKNSQLWHRCLRSNFAFCEFPLSNLLFPPSERLAGKRAFAEIEKFSGKMKERSVTFAIR